MHGNIRRGTINGFRNRFGIQGDLLTDFCDFRLRVRCAETDQMQVAYYANHFVWFEVGRAELCRNCGFSYQEMERRAGCFLMVAAASCRYRQPLLYDMEFVVRTRLQQLTRRTACFRYELRDISGDTVYAEGETRHVVVNNQGNPTSLPEPYRQQLFSALQPDG